MLYDSFIFFMFSQTELIIYCNELNSLSLWLSEIVPSMQFTQAFLCMINQLEKLNGSRWFILDLGCKYMPGKFQQTF